MSGAQAERYMDGSEMLREALVERLLRRMEEVNGRLERFLKNPGRLGAVQLSVVLSESALSYEVWREPSAVSERRARLSQSLGLSPAVDDASLVGVCDGIGDLPEYRQPFPELQCR